ncbi:BRO1-like domain-containing protein [Pseudomassariella vexata]|uniref:BRO1-like domain-domain-containing protein n=1 Tax=Pseudomassariella vexata TaxID=1141098 RepID=A0A1Y2D7F5_9PEZI|nr:BRO1-like domain-containing protein [Pseudomassariella vexata]ORY55127.1 BRO1-like domain-domain-containing protein [Pseudomassariella vexata]
MQSNILSVPFRKGAQLSLSIAVRQYISTKYDQHPDMFRQDLDVIDTLRRDAVNIREGHPSGVKKLQAYAAQLVWMCGKFPVDIGADFTWYPSLGYNTERPIVHNNLHFELANVLYNLAALYSHLAMTSNRSDTEGLKTAASFYSQSAGVLKHMKDEILPDLHTMPPEDMDENTLESLMQLQLAQSQECFWQKAVMDGYKDASIAKLAARVSDLYNIAGEAAMQSEAISSSWIHHMSAKHHHFAAAAQYRAACDCLEKRKYGEEVARLRDAVACVAEGLKESRGGYLNKVVVDDLNGLKKRVEEDLKRAEKDNDVIYLNVVPSKSELKTLDRANMAIARVPPAVAAPLDFLGDKGEFGPALFTKLVPYSVHIAVSIYEERRDRLVNQNIISELEVLNERIHEILSSLNLPGSIQAFEKPLGLPGTLVQHAEEIRQADAISRLQRSFADIDKLRAADIAVFEEGKELLQAEEEEDMRLRRRHGTERWSRPESRTEPSQGAKLWSQVGEAEGWFGNSASSDQVVRDKFRGTEPVLAVLAGPDRGMMDFVPLSRRTEIPETLRPAIGRLRGAYNDITRLESRRRRKAEALREKAKSDDIKSDILTEAARLERTQAVATAIVPAHFEDFFEKRLNALFAPDLELVRKEGIEQEKVIDDLVRVNREFESQKKVVGDKGNREREQALQKLENAYYKYKELVSNVEVGRKFYNDLSRIVGGFRDGARSYVTERRREARMLEDELNMPSLHGLSLGQPDQMGGRQAVLQSPGGAEWHGGGGGGGGTATGQQSYTPQGQQGYFAQQQQQQQQQAPRQQVHSPAEAHIQSWVPAGETVAPQPQQPRANPMQAMWNPEIGIKFAGGSGGRGTPAANQGPSKPAPGTWDPNSGIRFG